MRHALGNRAARRFSDPARTRWPDRAWNLDAVARAIAPAFGKATGHPVVVENIVGAGGIPGTTQIVKAPKDGLTLGMVSSNHVINPGIYKSIPYDSLKDITPIAVLATVPLVLVVNPALPVKTVAELLAYAKANPGKLNFGSAGNGSTLHLAGELLISETGIDMKHVPYRGTGQLITDLVGGQVQLGFASISQVGPHVKAGTLRALAVSTGPRTPEGYAAALKHHILASILSGDNESSNASKASLHLQLYAQILGIKLQVDAGWPKAKSTAPAGGAA